jgi:hypothetical protein
VEEALPGKGSERVVQTMYTHVSRCKSNKKKQREFILVAEYSINIRKQSHSIYIENTIRKQRYKEGKHFTYNCRKIINT